MMVETELYLTGKTDKSSVISVGIKSVISVTTAGLLLFIVYNYYTELQASYICHSGYHTLVLQAIQKIKISICHYSQAHAVYCLQLLHGMTGKLYISLQVIY